MLRRLLTATCLAAAALTLVAAAGARAPGTPAGPPAVDLRLLVKIPMRDGVRLNASLYLPEVTPAPAASLPVIFHLTPYTPDGMHQEAMYLARRGFAYAAVEVRGRGNSEGSFDFWVNDGRDGYDVAEWLARQPWSNGKVGMWGESYCGRAVWSTLKEGPPHLASAVPIAAGNAILSWDNFLTPDVMEGILMLAGTTLNANLGLDPAFLPGKYRELYLRHLPLRQLDRLAGFPSDRFQRMLDHPAADAFWHAISPGADDYRRLTLPILTITGQYDSNQAGALFYYRQHLRHPPPAGPGRHYLVIGPWDHHGTYRPRREVGGLTFGPASAVDMPELLAGWFGYTLRDEPLPPLLAKRVACYVAGAEQWRHADSLDSLTGVVERLDLASDGDPERGEGGAADLFHSGRLVHRDGAAPPAATAPADHWVYDPLDVSAGASEGAEKESWATDQGSALGLHGNGVVYHGAPLPREAEVIGTPRLEMSLAMDVADTDLEATLYLIAPDGASVLLGDAALRARYRHSAAKEELVHPGDIDRYELTFPFISRRLPRGSRLRLLVRSPNSIYWEKNYNSGGAVADESGRDARTAHITLYHDTRHASWLELPLAAAPAAPASASPTPRG